MSQRTNEWKPQIKFLKQLHFICLCSPQSQDTQKFTLTPTFVSYPCSTRSAMNNFHMQLFCINDLHSVAVLSAGVGKSEMFMGKGNATLSMTFSLFRLTIIRVFS